MEIDYSTRSSRNARLSSLGAASKLRLRDYARDPRFFETRVAKLMQSRVPDEIRGATRRIRCTIRTSGYFRDKKREKFDRLEREVLFSLAALEMIDASRSSGMI